MAPAVLDRSIKAQEIKLPPLPASVETALDALLANTRDRTASFLVSAVYGEQQVLTARVSDVHLKARSHAVAFDSYCLQPVIMYAIAIKLLLYARGETHRVEQIAWKDLSFAVERMEAADPVRDRLAKYIDTKTSGLKPIPFAVKRQDF